MDRRGFLGALLAIPVGVALAPRDDSAELQRLVDASSECNPVHIQGRQFRFGRTLHIRQHNRVTMRDCSFRSLPYFRGPIIQIHAS